MIDPSLPLVDLHRHLDGSVRLQTILELGLQHNLPLPARDLDGLRPYVQVSTPQPGVMAFISKFEWMTAVLVDYDACRRVAYENVEDARREGIDYVELRFSPLFMSQAHALRPAGVVEAVIDGVRAGERDFGLRANLIGILSRTYGPQQAWSELEALLGQRDALVGLDLAGDEANYPGEWFVEHFRQARDAGLAVTVHAGESAGAHSIWQAIDGLGAQRIGHCVAARDDQRLQDALLARSIGIELNLTSNLQTTTVGDYPTHPARAFLERGLLASLNTDDPGISGIDLPYEYNVAAPAAGLSPAQARQLQRNGLATAFLSAAERQALAQQKSAAGPAR
ncbi:MAG: adenosine deaminase [Chloroflexota bacterium]